MASPSRVSQDPASHRQPVRASNFVKKQIWPFPWWKEPRPAISCVGSKNCDGMSVCIVSACRVSLSKHVIIQHGVESHMHAGRPAVDCNVTVNTLHEMVAIQRLTHGLTAYWLCVTNSSLQSGCRHMTAIASCTLACMYMQMVRQSSLATKGTFREERWSTLYATLWQDQRTDHRWWHSLRITKHKMLHQATILNPANFCRAKAGFEDTLHPSHFVQSRSRQRLKLQHMNCGQLAVSHVKMQQTRWVSKPWLTGSSTIAQTFRHCTMGMPRCLPVSTLVIISSPCRRLAFVVYMKSKQPASRTQNTMPLGVLLREASPLSYLEVLPKVGPVQQKNKVDTFFPWSQNSLQETCCQRIEIQYCRISC